MVLTAGVSPVGAGAADPHRPRAVHARGSPLTGGPQRSGPTQRDRSRELHARHALHLTAGQTFIPSAVSILLLLFPRRFKESHSLI